MKRKVLTVVQDIGRAQEHEWVVKFLNRDVVEMHFALVNCTGSWMERFLDEQQIPRWNFSYAGKKSLPALTFALWKLMRRQKYQVVHTHLFESSLCGITASLLAGISSRFCTRHYSDYHHVWFPSAVKYDKYINRLATGIVATSENVKDILVRLEHVPEAKVHLIRHGIDMMDYQAGAVSPARVDAIRTKYGLTDVHPIVGAISRFTELKGLQYLIPAFKSILETYPGAVLVMANASGDYQEQINNLLEGLPKSNYRTIVFENDIAALYQVFNCFVHIPITPTAEAFGQTYLEALASGIPSVFTPSGVAPEFIVDREHAFLVPFCDSDTVRIAILKVLDYPTEAAAMAERGRNVVSIQFDVRRKVLALENLYLGTA